MKGLADRSGRTKRLYDDVDISNGSIPSTSSLGPECKKPKPRNSRDQTEDKKTPESGNWEPKVHIIIFKQLVML